MRIVTRNTWKNDGDYRRRMELIAVRLHELRADVICLQECFAGEADDTAAHLGPRTCTPTATAAARSIIACSRSLAA